MKFIDSKLGPVHYRTTGRGQPLVLLNGVMFTSQHWRGFDSFLSKKLRRKVITIDYPGIGHSTSQLPWSVEVKDLADCVTEVLDKEGHQKADFLGVSLGGMVGLAIAISHPERALSLFVINTSVAGLCLPRLNPKAILSFIANGGFNDQFNNILANQLLHHQLDPLERQKIKQAWKEIHDEQGWPRLTTFKQFLAAARFHPQKYFSDFKTPTLVLYSSDDAFVPHLNSLKLEKLLPFAKKLEIPGTGHEMFHENPEGIADAIRNFLKAS